MGLLECHSFVSLSTWLLRQRKVWSYDSMTLWRYHKCISFTAAVAHWTICCPSPFQYTCAEFLSNFIFVSTYPAISELSKSLVVKKHRLIHCFSSRNTAPIQRAALTASVSLLFSQRCAESSEAKRMSEKERWENGMRHHIIYFKAKVITRVLHYNKWTTIPFPFAEWFIVFARHNQKHTRNFQCFLLMAFPHPHSQRYNVPKCASSLAHFGCSTEQTALMLPYRCSIICL